MKKDVLYRLKCHDCNTCAYSKYKFYESAESLCIRITRLYIVNRLISILILFLFLLCSFFLCWPADNQLLMHPHGFVTLFTLKYFIYHRYEIYLQINIFKLHISNHFLCSFVLPACLLLCPSSIVHSFIHFPFTFNSWLFSHGFTQHFCIVKITCSYFYTPRFLRSFTL